MKSQRKFTSRTDAGRQLANALGKRKITADLVLGIPRGGVGVAREIGKALAVNFDVLVVKKLEAPEQPELAIGAITLGEITYIDTRISDAVGCDDMYIQQEIQRQQKALCARDRLLRKDKPALQIGRKRVILTDDGVATGSTMYAAIQWVKKKEQKA